MDETVHSWARHLPDLHAQGWKRLVRGVNDRRAAGRHPTIATVDDQGMPQARTVVLRAADPQAGILRVYTDRHAPKVAEVSARPHAALHIWDKDAHLQLRILARVAVRTGEPVADLWERIPEHARCNYGTLPGPARPIDEGLAYQRVPNFDDFAVLELTVESMELLHLGYVHRRARFERADDWAGQWLAP
jgi:pyridoxine/pyridoxamine 5'-phosphate oxidase